MDEQERSPFPSREPSQMETVFARYIFASSGVVLGCVAALGFNLVFKRPAISGLHRYALGSLSLAYLGEQSYWYSRSCSAERDAAIRHYVSLHPEDFRPPEPKYFNDVFLPWTPYR